VKSAPGSTLSNSPSTISSLADDFIDSLFHSSRGNAYFLHSPIWPSDGDPGGRDWRSDALASLAVKLKKLS